MVFAFEHPGWAFTRARVEELPEDADAQVAAVINRMTEYASADSESLVVRNAVAEAARSFPDPDIAVSIFNWIKSRISFTNDEGRAAEIPVLGSEQVLVEVLTRPVDLLTMRNPVGDCDDFSMLAASMLIAAGRPACFCTIAANRADPERFSHVYVETTDRDGRRLPFDVSHGSYPGWEATKVLSVYREQKWPVSRIGDLVLAILGAYLMFRLVK